ncbi:MAG: hypothetical protein ACC707_02285 [Thiohalomonadales bacterium]
MKDLANVSRLLLGLSLFALAASVAYFTLEASRVRTSLPELLQQIDVTAQKIEPIIGQIEDINKQIPNILEEVKQTRELVPPILTEVAELRKEIPAMLKEVEQIRLIVPTVLQEVEQIRVIVPTILQEVEQTRQQVPPILAEVKATREALPSLLDKGNKLVSNARNAGKEASQGAVSGFFSGIFRAPFAIVGDIGSSVYGFSNTDKKEYTEEDLSATYKAGMDLLESEKVNTKMEITSTDGKIHTTLTLIAIDTSGKYPCKTLHAKSRKRDKVITDKKNTLCKNSDGLWEKEE